MHPLGYISDNWQKWLPALAVLCSICWLLAFRDTPTTEQAMFAALFEGLDWRLVRPEEARRPQAAG